VYRILPKIGPLEPLSFKAPTPEAERLFTASLRDTRSRYAAAIASTSAGRLDLVNTDFDTGRPSAYGEYQLADETYAEPLKKLDERKFAGVPAALRANIKGFYVRGAPPKKVQKRLAALVRTALADSVN